MATRLFKHKLYGSVSMCTPGVRTVIVRAWASKQEDGSINTGHDYLPVIALRNSVVHAYEIEAVDIPMTRQRGYRTHKELLKAGWQYRSTHSILEPIITDLEGGLCTVFQACTYHDSWDTFSCPWSIEEDDQRLAEQIEELKRLAVEKVGSEDPDPAAQFSS